MRHLGVRKAGPKRNPQSWWAAMSRGNLLGFRPTSPMAERTHDRGLAIAKTKMVGESKRKIVAASFHFGPRRTKVTSSAKSAHVVVMGRVSARTRE